MENTGNISLGSKIKYVIVTLLPMAVYMVIYMPAFFWVESLEHSGRTHVIYTPVDSCIPVVEAFIVPYVLWLPYLLISMVAIGIKSRVIARKISYMLMTGMTVFIVISLIYPNALDLRDEIPDRENVFMSMVDYLHEIDTPTNVLPSLHVFDALCVATGIHFAFIERKLLLILSDILVFLIMLSTLFIKQHSLIDVFAAVMMFIVVFAVFFVIVKPLKSEETDR